jgi:hypothetical protein
VTASVVVAQPNHARFVEAVLKVLLSFMLQLRLALFSLYHETAPLQMTGDDDPLSIGHDFD